MDSSGRGTDGIEHFRITLLGKAGSGKSTTGNTILGSKMFKGSSNFSSVTSECKKAEAMVSGTRIEVLDSPRLFDTSSTQEDITAFISKVVMGLRPGPHALLYVLKTNRYTEEDYRVFKQLESLFDERMYYYLIVVITGGDNFEADGISPEDVIRHAPSKLRQVLTDCHNRYIIFNNRAVNKQPQVDKLLGMVREMVKTNGSSPYYRCTRYHQFLGQPLEEKVRGVSPGVEEEMFQERKEFRSSRMHPIQQRREMDDRGENSFFGPILAAIHRLCRWCLEKTTHLFE